jgi:large subunit ribosomal protein L22
MIEIKAKLNSVKVSQKKVRLVAGAVRGLSVVEALFRLPVIFKRSAPMIDKLLRSAVANAQDRYEVAIEDLMIKSIIVNKGMDLKRFKPAAFGRAHPFRKHSAHIAVVLTVKEGAKVVSKIKEKKVEAETVKLADMEKTTKVEAKDKAVKKVSKIEDKKDNKK